MTLTIEHEQSLADEMVGWLTTVHDGQPQTSPIGFLWARETLWIRSEPHRPKVRNINDNPHVSFHLDLRDGRVVSMECWATLVEGFPDEVRKDFSSKYAVVGVPDAGAAEREARFSACLRLSPTRIRSW